MNAPPPEPTRPSAPAGTPPPPGYPPGYPPNPAPKPPQFKKPPQLTELPELAAPPLLVWLPAALLLTWIACAEAAFALTDQAALPPPNARHAHRPNCPWPLDLVLFTGLGTVTATFLALRHHDRCHRVPGSLPLTRPLLLSGLLLGLWLGTVLLRYEPPEETVAFGLFVWLPAGLLTWALADRALRLSSFWPGLATLIALIALTALGQVAGLNERGRPRDERALALASLPIAAALGFWLAAYGRNPVTIPPRPGP